MRDIRSNSTPKDKAALKGYIGGVQVVIEDTSPILQDSMANLHVIRKNTNKNAIPSKPVKTSIFTFVFSEK